MILNQYIKSFFESSHSAVHSKKKGLIAGLSLREQYHCIKNFIANKANPGSIVAIKMPHNHFYLLSLLACMELGVCYLPMNNAWPDERIEQIKTISNYAFLIDSQQMENIFLSPSPEQPSLTTIPAPDSPLYMIFTSGTQGIPKGVVISRRAYENFLCWVDRYFDLPLGNKLLFIADFSFDMSLLDVALLLAKKGQAFFSAFDGNIFTLGSEIIKYSINSIATVPNNINMLLTDGVHEKVDFSNLRALLLGGARFSYGTYQKILSNLPPHICVYNLFGPTEATVYTHVKKLDRIESSDLHDGNVTIGRPFNNNTGVVLTENLTDAPAFVKGQLYLGGPQLMTEYYQDPKKTMAAFEIINGDRFYKTGDIGFLDDQGQFFITGRLNETIKRQGYRIDLLDIDSYIQKIEHIAECMTLAIPNEEYENRIITAIKVTHSSYANRDDIMQKLTQVLAPYQLPDEIIFIDEFPRGHTGKISRQQVEIFYQKSKATATTEGKINAL